MTEHNQPPDRYASLLLDNQLCFGLYAAANSIIRAYRPLLAELGVTLPAIPGADGAVGEGLSNRLGAWTRADA